MRDVEFDEHTVTLELPPRGQFRRVARAAASACCAVEGMSVETLADVRLLVNDVFQSLSSIAAGPISMLLTPLHGHVVLGMFAPPRPGSDWGTSELPLLEAMASVVAIDPAFGGDEELVHFTAVVREDPST